MSRYRLTRRLLSVPESGQRLLARVSTRCSANTFRSWAEETTLNGVLKNSGVFREPAIRAVGASIATRSMNARSFFDTNILVYADDKRAAAKQNRAIDRVAEHRRNGTGVVSLQVLQ